MRRRKTSIGTLPTGLAVQHVGSGQRRRASIPYPSQPQRRHHLHRMTGIWRSLVIAFFTMSVVMAGGAGEVITSSPASAATFPGNTNSWYVNAATTPTFVEDQACAQVQYAANENLQGTAFVVLDFGTQIPNSNSSDGWGVYTPGGVYLPDVSKTQALDVIGLWWYYYLGWAQCDPGHIPLRLMIGTTNGREGSIGTLASFTTGKVWGAFTGYLWSYGLSIHGIYASGGDDVEATYSSWYDESQWIGGFEQGGPGVLYYDYGDAAGCPQSGSPSPTAVCQTPTSSWQVQDFYWAAYGAGGSQAMPEIYYWPNALEWNAISHMSGSSRGLIHFSAITSEATACSERGCVAGYTNPGSAWSDFLNVTGQSVTDTDIGWPQ